MPDLRSIGLHISPADDPIRYPGDLATASCLVAESWLYRMHPQEGAVVDGWEVELDGGPLAHDSLTVRSALGSVLGAAGAAPMADRYPVLAVGSNAAPGQLRRKFSGSPVSTVVPLTRVRVSGIGLSHSAHVSSAGYIAYAPFFHGEPAGRPFHMLWLDDRQLARLDATEPNYRSATVSGSDLPAVLETGMRLRQFGVYLGRWGVLRLPHSGLPVPASTQREVYGLLASYPWFTRLVPESIDGVSAAIGALATANDRRVAIREAMAFEGFAMGTVFEEA